MSKDTELMSFYPLSEEFKSQDSPFYWVARLNAKYSSEMDSLLKPRGLSSTKWRVLMILNEQGRLSMSDISIHSVAKLSTITKIVYKMREDGLVDISASLKDGRVSEVELTPQGSKKLQEAKEATHRLVERAYAKLEISEITQLNRCLSKIFNNLN
ncbi:MarR family transcriptional regulator [Halomonas sp. McH1-25]|uniref:MarR family winged helix-turn-helix transcriptional regulator n=1 Tax=unclassified Halomonas TaxID=2609666 RepID=UPI001EF69DEA|nr:MULTISPECIES: MarR family transcriptional regulator [unclassified Halomonas]MCG7602240.1 MarR family transcriptional regulator [Halomonas sp. McH1-25]MCP1344595.1 MarR family transcriptional regulator [Halomonas sp. FL8]MCP1362869.1 MarR family transcriptional regulator [Halomonas sp. BBD45]MCP1363745.1 MarR family transcriptional regulator [Halomonas sp. BBD48]